MELHRILEQIDSLNDKLDATRQKHTALNRQIESVAKCYQQTEASVHQLARNLSGILPSSLLGRFHQMAEEVASSVKLSSELNSLDRERENLLRNSIGALDQLQSAQHKYENILAAAGKKQRQEAQILGDLHRDIYEQRQLGQHKLADQLSEDFNNQYRAASKLSKQLFQQYVILQNRTREIKLTAQVMNETEQKNQDILETLQKTEKKNNGWNRELIEAANNTAKIFGDLKGIATITGFTLLFVALRQVNQDLINANSLLEHRLKLLRANVVTSTQIGASLEDTTDAQKALLAIGLKHRALDTSALRALTQLNLGLGISHEQSALLLRTTTLVSANFQQMGDSLAAIVNQTELTNSEAAALANRVAQITRNLGLTTRNLPAVTATLGAISGQLKALGAADDTAGNLVEKFSQLRNIGMAMLFGGTGGLLDPKAFDDAAKMQQMILNTGKTLQNMTGGDPLLLSSFEPLLQQMGLTLTDARALIEMADPSKFNEFSENIRKTNLLREQTNLLEKRYREQQSAAGKQWDLLKNQAIALVRLGLTPILDALVPLMEGLNYALASFVKFTTWLERGESVWSRTFGYILRGLSGMLSVIAGGVMLRALGSAAGAVTRLAGALAAFAGRIAKLRSLVNLGGWLSELPAVSYRWLTSVTGLMGRALTNVTRTFFTNFIPKLGRTLLNAISHIPWGAFFKGLARKIPIIGSILDTLLIGKAGLETHRTIKARREADTSTTDLDAYKESIRKKYNIPLGEDVLEWLNKAADQRRKDRSSVEPRLPTRVLPATNKPALPEIHVAPIATVSRAPLTVNQNDQTITRHALAEVVQEISVLRKTVQKIADSDQQLSKAQANRDQTRQRLDQEHTRLIAQPNYYRPA